MLADVQLQALAEALDRALNGECGRETGFVLLLFPFDEPDDICSYVSNGADRTDVARTFRAMIRHIESGPEFGDVMGHA